MCKRVSEPEDCPGSGAGKHVMVIEPRGVLSAWIAINCKPDYLLTALFLSSLKNSGTCTYDWAKTRRAVVAQKGH